MNKRRIFYFLIPLLCVALSSLLLFTNLNARFSDLFQKMLPATELRQDVILVGIDDYAIDTIGSFPFTRDVYADCITMMQELGTESVVFDLSFIDNSGAAVNDKFEPFYPDEVMAAALASSDITYLNFTFDYFTDIDDYEKEVMDQKGLAKNIDYSLDANTREYTGVLVTIPDFLEHAQAAGFVNADPDSDNYYRRVNPIVKFDGNYYLQLTMPALLKKLGNPKIIAEKRKIILQDALLSDGSRKDIVIPRTDDGSVIIKYPKMLFNDYNYLSIGDIYRLVQFRKYMAEDGEEEYIEEYTSLYSDLKGRLASALCIVGTCATSTSDYGVNLYEAQYPLPGLHYSFSNQVLNQDFIGQTPFYYSLIFALLLSYFLVFLTNRLKGTGSKVLLGFIIIALGFLILLSIFVFTRTYLPAGVPMVSVVLVYISTILIGFLSASKDKKIITNAFSQCLSKDIVNQIVANPDSFKLGGDSVEMTAIFTDIQKFSSFSELLSASQLVALLNYYLTKMSDIIMGEGGTIDKYEGDAIIALVGAPLRMSDHANRAVKAAIKMKAAEKVMNEEIKFIASKPKPDYMDDNLYSAFTTMVQNGKEIFTRIGINSGEMIAGYMGSENKKNYTMMGNNVNLAARLEGVNKQYSTYGILISHASRSQLSPDVLCRRLDKVQVVNVNTPILLYEPMGLKENDDGSLAAYIDGWEEAMNEFDNARYQSALDKFNELLKARPDDKVAAYYIKLIEKFFIAGRAPTEDDDIGVVYNPELKCFRLLSK